MVFLIGYLVYRWYICLERRLPVTKLQPFDWWELRPFLMLKLSFLRKIFLFFQKNWIASGHMSKNVLSEGQDYLIIFSLIVLWQRLLKLPANVQSVPKLYSQDGSIH